MQIKKLDSMNVIFFIDILLTFLVIILILKKVVNLIVDMKNIIRVNEHQAIIKGLEEELFENIFKKMKIALKLDKNAQFKFFINMVYILKELNFERFFIVIKVSL